MKITEPTWIIHAVCDKGDIVYHTHGLNEYGSLELELKLSLNKKQAMDIINLIAFDIANGIKYKDGDINDTLFSCKIAFKEVKGIHGEGEENLRIILPDPDFKFPWDSGCMKEYRNQLPLNN